MFLLAITYLGLTWMFYSTEPRCDCLCSAFARREGDEERHRERGRVSLVIG